MFKERLLLAVAYSTHQRHFHRRDLSESRPQMSVSLTYKVHMDEFLKSQMAAPQVSNLPEVKV